jgi:hypothetical protein
VLALVQAMHLAHDAEILEYQNTPRQVEFRQPDQALVIFDNQDGAHAQQYKAQPYRPSQRW